MANITTSYAKLKDRLAALGEDPPVETLLLHF